VARSWSLGRFIALARAATARFRTLNCAALPDDLVEAELFGHARGSFTGALSERAGVFEEAHGGTLFLDEIGELSLRAQAKVLRVIQEGELRRIGEKPPAGIDVRISRRRTVSCTRKSTRDASGSTCCTGSMSFGSRCRRSASGARTSRFWPNTSGATRPNAWAAALRSARPRLQRWRGMTGRGTSASCRTCWPRSPCAVPKRGVVPPTALPPAFGGRRDEESWRLDAARRVFDEQFVRAALVRTGGHRSRAAEELGVSRQGLTKLMTRLGIMSDRAPHRPMKEHRRRFRGGASGTMRAAARN
jgi:hypothetical protein